MNDEEAGSVKVFVTGKQVHNAVRSILTNDYKLDPESLKKEVREHAEKIIQKEVIDYISGSGYSQTALSSRLKTHLEYSIRGDLTTIVKEVVTQLVYKEIRDQIEGVVGVILTKGLEFQIGYNKEKVKLTIKDEKSE